MTVAELIEELSKMDQTLEVSIDIGGKSIDVTNVNVTQWTNAHGSFYNTVEIS